ncbi:peptidase S41 [Aurantibacter crassamenti]|uniref:S41 family peptidase n=1 Tax=Aurantibacter crassamenti TaxID=1837375 RepID=UPI0019399846|nr:S41 family peptidase [Aurantibacter crassamenti]MBM1105198.1 peptidase S41 [Aurantibacter crassamenti]
MKKFLLFLVFTIIFSHSIFAQKQLSETEKLATTSKIWGFLKYYHPQVANGGYDWDKQLFIILPKVKSATNTDELSQVFLNWIDGLGEVKKCKKCDQKNADKYFDKNFDLSWMNNQLFTSELSKKLKYIEGNRHQGKKKYVAYYSNKLKIADFTNEIDYKDFDWEDENLRLLSLFRYWNMVEYFFPYKYQTDANWDTVLHKMIPKFLYPKSETDFHLSMVELAANINDGHVRLNTNKTYLHFGHYYLPVKFKLINNKAVVTGIFNDSLAKLNDLKIGDIITKADNKTIKTIFQEEENYIMASNNSRKKLNASYYILNGPTDSFSIEVVRDGKIVTKSVKRYLYKDFNYKAKVESEKYKVLEGNIGYVDIGKVELKEVSKVMEALKNTTAIIFDIRKTTSFTPYYIAKYITSQKRAFYKALEMDLNYPGRYNWTEALPIGDNKLKYTGKVILLVDENCQSQKEFTAMCLQVGDDVTTIGRQTSGADGNVSIFNMVGGYKTQFSGVGIFYPDGTETQRKGVKIDIEVKPTIDGVIAGKDEILEKAIQFINEQM